MEDKSVKNGNSCVYNSTTSNRASENCHLLGSAMRFDLKEYKDKLANRNVRVDLLAILFGIGSWTCVNSMFIQLPLIVSKAPEGWGLPSYLSIIVQIANIGPLCYTLFQRYSPRKLKDSYVIYAIYAIGCAASILMAFFYEKTAVVAGENRSVALMALGFCFAIVGCTSSVLFMPYMGRFREIYLITYLIGEGLSGFLASIMALIQGIGGAPECRLDPDTMEYEKYTSPPRFGTREFFIFVFAVMIVSGVAFILLNKLRMCKKEYAAAIIGYGNDYSYDRTKTLDSTDKTTVLEEDKKISPLTYNYLLVVMALVSLIGSGVFPGVQSYSCLPYGYRSYHLTATLTAIANPAACFLAVFLKHTSIKLISLYFAIAAILTAYILSTAVLSFDSLPLIGKTSGEALIVLFWTLVMGLISYIKLSITSVFRFQGGKSLVWLGSVSQIGSACGALMTFLIINRTNVFVSYEPSCPF
ncbi:Riboflavin transporter 2 [Pseudolycoriella hygida]|uniref:Riboflavin transporter n=1 Tax=Pseudolycoriella hygida TaxID=35572 RepID=A0A9Q0RZN1_9DIPT|nr:Riboflavin transporter 2 [Pseudolycoriella hygida]